MTNFIKDNTALPYPKSDLRARPASADPNKWGVAAEWNTVCGGLYDVQQHLRQQFVNAGDYGVVADGVTDDRAALQLAIDSLGSAGGTVLLPHGNCRITPSGGAGLVIANPNVRLLGHAHHGTTITATANCPSGLIKLVGGAQVAGAHAAAAAGNACGFSVEGVRFVGTCALSDLLPYDSGTYAVSGCIMASSTAGQLDVSDVSIVNCEFSGFDQCITSWYSADLPTAYRWRIRHCKFTGLSPSDFTLVSPRLHIPIRLCGQDCLAFDNTTDGFTYGINMYPCGQTLPIPGRNRILSNIINLASAHDVGIYISSSNDALVAFNEITAPAGRLCMYNGGLLGDGGIKIGANGNQVGMGNVQVVHNVLHGCQIKISSHFEGRVQHNTVVDSPSYGVMFDSAVTAATPSPFSVRCVVSDNHLIRPSGSGIAASATTIRHRNLDLSRNIIVNPGAWGVTLNAASDVALDGTKVIYTDYSQPAGTLAMTSGSASVVGTGTSFVALDVGRKIIVDGTTYTIATWTDATHITVSPNAVRTNATAGYAWKDAGPEGTVAVTNGSSAFTGSGTSFRSSDVGKTMVVDGQNYVVSSVTSATAGTFTTTVSTATNPVATYTWSLGTVSITNASSTVTGSGTSFSPSDAGRAITINGTTYTILSVNSPTSLTLTANASSTFSGAWTWGQSQAIYLNNCDHVSMDGLFLDYTCDTVNAHSGILANNTCKNLQVKFSTILGFAFGVRFQADTSESQIFGNKIRGRSVNNTDIAVFLDNSALSVGNVVAFNDCYGYAQSATNNTAFWFNNSFGTSRAPTAFAFQGPTAPAIAANTGAGTTPTIAIQGSDREGKITLTTGSAPAASADVCTATFNVALPVAPYVTLTPGNAAAAALSGNAAVYVTPATTTFKISVGSTNLVAATQYIWHYRL